jgi:cholesterol transport system auxiliary component
MRARFLILISAALFCALGAAGCGGITKSYPERSYYMFEAPPAEKAPAPVKGAVAQVWKFSVSPGSDGKEFVYRTDDISYESDFYNQFFRAPGALLTETTIRWLADTGLFEDVISSLGQGFASYFIQSNVVELYGDYRGAPAAVMTIQFFLLEYTPESEYGDSTGIIFNKTYSSHVPIPTASAPDLMRGWNAALGEIYGALLEDLKLYVKPFSQAAPVN